MGLKTCAVAGDKEVVSYSEGLGRVLGLAGLVGRCVTLAILLQDWVYVLKGQIQILAPLCPCTAVPAQHVPLQAGLCWGMADTC